MILVAIIQEIRHDAKTIHQKGCIHRWGYWDDGGEVRRGGVLIMTVLVQIIHLLWTIQGQAGG